MNANQTENGNAQRQESDFVLALNEGEMQAHFLPKVDLRSAHVVGVEALARWSRPDMAVISAAEFIDRVGAGAQMRALTETIIEFSTRAAGDWWRSGLGLQVSVNLPLSAISGSEWNLAEFVTGALDESGLPGDALQFEVTEDGLLSEPDLGARLLRELSDLGATISIDDFGTGHFSLRQLKTLPIEELKIDRSLIAGLEAEENRIIVRSTIHLGHQMGLQVVAEGVETESEWRQLRSMGCERAQGFLIARPLPAREVPAWLASWNQRARELSSTKSMRRTAKAARKRREATAA